MAIEEKFRSYYYGYLGIEKESLNKLDCIFECDQRNRPLNNCYFQHLIATNIDGKFVFSISPDLYKDFKEYMTSYKKQNYEELVILLDKFFIEKIENYSIKKMYRLAVEGLVLQFARENAAIKLTRDILMNSLGNMKLEEKNEVWNRKKEEVEQGRQYVVLDNCARIVSYCKISDINYGGGNLVVWTAPEYRGNGYAKETVICATKWCFDNNIMPIYWVDSSNTVSIKLAKSLGFKIQAEEFVVSTKLQ